MGHNLGNLILNYNGLTHVGKVRTTNEDTFGIIGNGEVIPEVQVAHDYKTNERGFIAIVADGMGGAEAGEVASDIALKTVTKLLTQLESWPGNDKEIRESLVSSILAAHFNIVNYALEDPKTSGMGTTIAIALFLDNQVHVAWCGDSRIYRFNPNLPLDHNSYESQFLRKCTHDHSMVWDYVLKGKISAEEARVHPQSNVITQSLGSPDNIPFVDNFTFQLLEGDKWLICSDGLNGMVSDDEIEDVLGNDSSTDELNRQLLERALVAGGMDNISSVLVSIVHIPVLSHLSSNTKEANENNIHVRPEMITQSFTNEIEIKNNRDFDIKEGGENRKKHYTWLILILIFCTAGIFGKIIYSNNTKKKYSKTTTPIKTDTVKSYPIEKKDSSVKEIPENKLKPDTELMAAEVTEKKLGVSKTPARSLSADQKKLLQDIKKLKEHARDNLTHLQYAQIIGFKEYNELDHDIGSWSKLYEDLIKRLPVNKLKFAEERGKLENKLKGIQERINTIKANSKTQVLKNAESKRIPDKVKVDSLKK